MAAKHRVGEAEDMDMFEPGWSMQENTPLFNEKKERPMEKVGALLPDLGSAGSPRAGGFLPSIGGSATARLPGAQPIGLTPAPPPGSQSARPAAGSLPTLTGALNSASHPGAGAAQRERQARQKQLDSEIFKKAFAVSSRSQQSALVRQ